MVDNHIYCTNQQKYNVSKSVFNQFPTTQRIAGYFSSPNIYNGNNNLNVKSRKTLDKYSKIVIGIGIGMLFFSRGVQKITKNSLEKLNNFFEGKLDTFSLLKKHNKISFYEHFVRKINSFIKKSESINNITSLKDILFMKLMYKTKPTHFIHDKISKFFERLSVNTVKKSYKRTQNDFDNMYNTFDNLDNYLLNNSADELVEFRGKKISKRELISKAKDYRDRVKLVVDSFILEDTQKSRYKYIKDTTSKLYSDFWNASFKDFWTKDNKFKGKQMWQTFIASEQVKCNKTTLAEYVAFARNMLSFTNEEKLNYLSGYVKNLSSIISADDAEGIKMIKRIEWFAKEPLSVKEGKDAFLSEIDKFDKYSIKTSSDQNIAESQINDKNTNIRLIRNLVTDSGTGELQDMLNIYHVIAPFELVKSRALESAQKAVKSFDKSVNLEVGEFFDKTRDLDIGSAPTDILTILLSCGMITSGLMAAKSSDEKVSVILKSGIPIIGAVATSLISATKLVSGGKSLVLGFVSGFVLNQLGRLADKYRIKYFANIRG